MWPTPDSLHPPLRAGRNPASTLVLPQRLFPASSLSLAMATLAHRLLRPVVHTLVQTVGRSCRRAWTWVDTEAAAAALPPAGSEGERRVEWARIVPFIGLHLACLGAFAVGVSPVALAVATALYLVRMFGITAGFHRYFSHRAFRTSRAGQFALAVLANASAQRGPLWWAAHHREHHGHTESAEDIHSPRVHGLLWSHVGWLTTREAFRTDLSRVPDLARFPELRLLDRFDVVVPTLLAAGTWALGAWLERVAPQLGTSGPQMLVWGFFISTVVLFHATCTINSLAHRFGTRRFATGDESRNNPWLALLTLGEGWHNNHHHYPHSVRQGFCWWEFDPTWWALAALARLGLVRDLRPLPTSLRGETPAPTETGP